MEWTRPILENLDRWIDVHGPEFAGAEPFPHAVIDDVFDAGFLREVLAEFPSPEADVWDRAEDTGIQVKLRSNWTSDVDMEPKTRELVHFLNSGAFLDRIARLTGIEKLISDPYYTGGGLNCILPGGLLDVHCDGNWHHRMAVHRRLNAILYLNENWQTEWHGEFELWDREMTACVKAVAPAFNRLLVFETHDYSYHGHPVPLACPEGESRKSVIVYYYTSTPRPEEQVLVNEPHRALWRTKSLNPLG
jgi:Rps23 Pro-64 3,4-dihydroxylase Tpa1-like proline 4-hydroxylase